MQLIEVTDKKSKKLFHKVPHLIYAGDPNWACLLEGMVESVFDPEKNPSFKNGEAIRWVLMDDDNKPIGRIGAFFDSDYSEAYDQPTGGIGFFECVNDKEAAFLLFDTAKNWLRENGQEAMDGPINFGENFFYWGLLLEGEKLQTFGMQYHPPHYRQFFEEYGFKIFYRQLSYSLDITNPDLPDRFWKIAERVSQKPEYTFEHFSFKEQDRFIYDFIEIHRRAWSGHGNYKPARYSQLKEMISEARFILDEEFIWFVYHNGNPIAFFMMIPDVNQLIRKIKSGKMNLMNLLKLLYYKKTKTITKCRVIVLGVVPKFQRRGIESGIFYHLKKVMLRKSWYNDMEMSWIGDFNPKMIAMFKSFGATHTLTHATMRYLFDREKEFKRAPVIS
ncbi:MAG: GNAT family N-acetyltransferase [Tangfeifania sp.]